ncbi:hypothetical protein JM47_02395 [Ureaplasma diversum]|uniref:Probable dual-specificity RNA methyltransferase RlmN n=2 Tax=Ureaplasma diversum TaxID=42094 RepID=A0A084EYH4_9BACT|nr:23S rRNA (adenine(2503)-C(2))-methyltransferase RlmN [Ureaplasma diversum]AJQ45415.1 hypothetical protein JM47_02395 [Ureaplasma diversum]KEZ23016.1 Hypothetical protein, putative ribosomal RNA large subunit methyltransferase, radical SAM enzyme [Ureaplasma diversum NCTC 246]
MLSANKPLLFYDYTLEQLEAIVIENNLKPYLAKQIYEWIYKHRTLDFDKMSNLSKQNKEWLQTNFSFDLHKTVIKQVSEDGTIKFLFELADGNKIETVLMKFEYGYSVCVTTQVGCNMGCSFCASGILKKKRNLSSGEIVLQVYQAQKYLDEYSLGRVGNIVVMGIGEPFDNIPNVSNFINIVNNPFGLEIGKRKITVSTCGLVHKFAEWTQLQPQVGLAISLHAPNDQIRSSIMPINKAFNIEKLLAAAKEYTKITNNKITFEYIMIDGINDQDEHAYELVNLLKGMLCYVNLIPYNPVSENGYKRSKNVDRFFNILIQNNIRATTRQEKGSDIDAACGQLRAKEQGVL